MAGEFDNVMQSLVTTGSRVPRLKGSKIMGPQSTNVEDRGSADDLMWGERAFGSPVYPWWYPLTSRNPIDAPVPEPFDKSMDEFIKSVILGEQTPRAEPYRR